MHISRRDLHTLAAFVEEAGWQVPQRKTGFLGILALNGKIGFQLATLI